MGGWGWSVDRLKEGRDERISKKSKRKAMSCILYGRNRVTADATTLAQRTIIVIVLVVVNRIVVATTDDFHSCSLALSLDFSLPPSPRPVQSSCQLTLTIGHCLLCSCANLGAALASTLQLHNPVFAFFFHSVEPIRELHLLCSLFHWLLLWCKISFPKKVFLVFLAVELLANDRQEVHSPSETPPVAGAYDIALQNTSSVRRAARRRRLPTEWMRNAR